MRKIEIELNEALNHKRDWRKGNTAVWFVPASETGSPYGDRAEVKLHNNLIAVYWYDSGEVEVEKSTFRRYPTATTASRLRALGIDARIKNGVATINGEEV